MKAERPDSRIWVSWKIPAGRRIRQSFATAREAHQMIEELFARYGRSSEVRIEVA
jgi:hypothetical protein